MAVIVPRNFKARVRARVVVGRAALAPAGKLMYHRCAQLLDEYDAAIGKSGKSYVTGRHQVLATAERRRAARLPAQPSFCVPPRGQSARYSCDLVTR
jgi:hypothetical protein